MVWNHWTDEHSDEWSNIIWSIVLHTRKHLDAATHDHVIVAPRWSDALCAEVKIGLGLPLARKGRASTPIRLEMFAWHMVKRARCITRNFDGVIEDDKALTPITAVFEEVGSRRTQRRNFPNPKRF
ncbi:hypothetical protein PIIN_10609 [Serendipita indica DSM 11827]|uniref:Uncharacterized protein n=1 Tax=Serendipita indica (strain DSM 11827) TaxID=1109443 RepID=G4TZ75_SERID|nr:hypothetical protein PIIN_10609 [Serendipita indica DSM 11827]